MTKETKSADSRTANTTEKTRGSVAPLGWDKISGSEETSAEASKHTPTPWETCTRLGFYQSKGRIFIRESANGDHAAVIAEIFPHRQCQADWAVVSKEEREANAAFIVRAVNSHDELLAALKWSETIVHGYFHAENSEERNHYAFDMEHALKTMRAAIARAEGRAQ